MLMPIIVAVLLIGGLGNRIIDSYGSLADANMLVAVSLAVSGVRANARPVTLIDIDDGMRRNGINPKTVAKWRNRKSVSDERTGPRDPKSTVLTFEEEAVGDALCLGTMVSPQAISRRRHDRDRQ